MPLHYFAVLSFRVCIDGIELDSQFQNSARPGVRTETGTPVLDQSSGLPETAQAVVESSVSNSNDWMSELSLGVERTCKPQLIVRRNDIQLDFSYLPGSIGDEYAQVLGHKIIDVPPMTVLRVYDGEYGADIDETGKLQTGGLQQHIRKLDRALASAYPIEIHVIHRSYTDDSNTLVKEKDWPGVIHLHPVKNFGVQPDAHSEIVKDISRQVGADIVHMHITDTRLAALVSEKSEDRGLAVTFHNGLVTADSDLTVATLRSSDMRAILDIAQKHLESSGFFKGSLEALKEVVSKVRRRILKTSSYAPLIYDRAALRAEKSTFFAAGLASVSKHNQVEFADRASAVVGVPMDIALFSPDSITPERKQELREELGVTGKRVLLCHGRIHALKGQHYLPHVAAKLEEITQSDFTIIILGPSRDVAFMQELRGLIADRKVADRFMILDGRPNEYIRDVLAITDVMLFPTRIEALGGAGIEAGLMEVPVVGHHIGGVPEVVAHGKSGYLLPVGDTNGMANRIAELLHNENLRVSMGKYAREHCVSRYDAINVATRYVELVYGPQVLGGRA